MSGWALVIFFSLLTNVLVMNDAALRLGNIQERLHQQSSISAIRLFD